MRSPEPVVVTSAFLRGWPLPPPGPTKDAGRTLIVGGSCQNPGAVILAAEAALRSGACKLQVATVADLAPQVATVLPEALVKGLPSRPDGDLAAGAADTILELADGCSSSWRTAVPRSCWARASRAQVPRRRWRRPWFPSWTRPLCWMRWQWPTSPGGAMA